MTVRRREFLCLSAAVTASACLIPKAGLAIPTQGRALSLFDPRRYEALDIEYWTNGWYIPDAMARLNHFMRDWRTDDVIDIDPNLLDILYVLQQRTGTRERLHLVSGYRSPQSNAYLAARSRGVARNSYHIYGRAADITVPDYNLAGLRQLALSLEAGGVGYYPRSDFVHVDTGPVRNW